MVDLPGPWLTYHSIWSLLVYSYLVLGFPIAIWFLVGLSGPWVIYLVLGPWFTYLTHSRKLPIYFLSFVAFAALAKAFAGDKFGQSPRDRGIDSGWATYLAIF